jgi:short subunit dehydrogenase-like uncharacterized protein
MRLIRTNNITVRSLSATSGRRGGPRAAVGCPAAGCSAATLVPPLGRAGPRVIDMPTTARDHDVVLFGATGFAGALTARYLAAQAPAGLRWALAGRNLDKLAALRDTLGVDVPLLRADVTDRDSVQAVADATRVVATTVGPYLHHGEPLVGACARAGTDYLDLTGEPEFVDRMWLQHHDRAVASGARLIHACGFDSIPADLGVQFAVEHLPADADLRLRGAVRASGLASGGTFNSALTAFGRLGPMRKARRERVAAERSRREQAGEPPTTASAPLDRIRRDATTGRWLLPLPTIDAEIVANSARALHWGRSFSYTEYAAVKNPAVAVGGTALVGGLVAAAQVPPLRKALGALRPPGSGPTDSQRAKAWFRLRITGEGGGERVVVQVAGGDPGYTETAVMLGESAICLACDDLPQTAGQVTTATAMGATLRKRLVAAGLGFDVLAED